MKSRPGRDNIRLRQCFNENLPLIYFFGVSEGRYEPILCQVVGDERARLMFRVAPIEASSLTSDPILRHAAIIRFDREYTIAAVRRRLHQGRFRAAVLDAYGERCAICHLRHSCLLDAAHIIPDRERLGEAMVPNGLALCKLHHAAFDGHLVGITTDLEIHIARGLLDERDGPMLEHGLRGFHGKRLAEPSIEVHRPDRELLAIRWKQFSQASH